VAESQNREGIGSAVAVGESGEEVVHPHAAGVDVGNSAHYVAVRPDRDPQPVRRFECFTANLPRLANWLQIRGVRTVALQSAGCIASSRAKLAVPLIRSSCLDSCR
jgi:hypothetical protein